MKKLIICLNDRVHINNEVGLIKITISNDIIHFKHQEDNKIEN